ncbi:MAG: PEGA domain-containing protein, partial [Myxococcales bacterium]|nr:PEGA domain-containing protein [Myxococcales bacterium]
VTDVVPTRPEDDDVTELHSGDFESLLAEFEADDDLSKGERAELLAEHSRGALQTVVADLNETLLGDLDLPPPRAESISEPLFPAVTIARSRVGMTWAVTVVMLLGILAGSIWASARSEESPALPSTGLIILDIEPASGTQIFLDGALTSGVTGGAIRDVPIGSHSVEVRSPGYVPQVATVQVEQGRAPNLTIRLEPSQAELRQLTLRMNPPDATLYVDGRPRSPVDGMVDVQVEPQIPRRVEAVANGYWPYQTILSADSAPTDEVLINLQPLEPGLDVTVYPEGRVLVDGTLAGFARTGSWLRLGTISPGTPRLLTIEPTLPGYLPVSSWVVLEGYATDHRAFNLPLQVSPNSGQPEPTDAPPSVGGLAIETSSGWYEVWIDDRPTGLSTPISSDAPLVLRTGTRHLELRRGAEQVTFTANITEGTILALQCDPDNSSCRAP